MCQTVSVRRTLGRSLTVQPRRYAHLKHTPAHSLTRTHTHRKEGIYQSSLFCYCMHSFDMSSDCGLCKRGNQITGPTGAELQPPPAYTNRNKPRLSISNNRTTTFTSRLLRSLSSHLKGLCIFVCLCIQRRLASPHSFPQTAIC